MKNTALFSALFALALAGLGCKEQCIDIPPLGQGVVSDHKVLIEEFTGIQCQNCPQGSAEIANLRGLYPGLIAVSIHAGVFSVPLPESKHDFRTTEGAAIETFLGAPIGYPSAVVDRKAFPGGFGLQAPKAKWASFIQQQLAIDPGMAINLKTSYDPTTRQLAIDMTILPTKNIPGDHRFSVMLTEDHIIDVQIDGPAHIEDYEHEHVLRAMLTPFDGKVLDEQLQAGVPILRQFTFTVPAGWKAGDCHVVAFVHHGGNPDKAVLQAEESPFY